MSPVLGYSDSVMLNFLSTKLASAASLLSIFVVAISNGISLGRLALPRQVPLKLKFTVL